MDQTCVGLAAATMKTWTNIYVLGHTITTLCPAAKLEMGTLELRPPSYGSTPSKISVLQYLDDCAKMLVSHPAP